ncbi:MAG: site-specific DNA-methyltransferase [Candidatus Hecatellales archaeon]|nr:MAG: site-specific DNA-methyltransferase [Candidatus Hecatellales archaeon]
MEQLEDGSVHLVVTSPPYPMIELWDSFFRRVDRGIERLWRRMEQAETLREKTGLALQVYERMHRFLAEVWREVYRVLVDGGIACINIGDAARNIGGFFRVYPNHAKVIEHCEKIGFTTLPYILWKKPTNKPKYKGKGAFLGSGFLPPNAYITLDCEYILIFRKGAPRKFKPKDRRRYLSSYTKRERDRWFTQIWEIPGARQKLSQAERRTAAFPEEVPRRLIRMFSLVGDWILDPFLGTGTTVKAAIELERNSIGYEVDQTLKPVIQEKISRVKGKDFEVVWEG